MAGRIPQSFINDLLDRVDIVDVVGRRMKLKKAGKDYSGLCPFHDEKTPSFTVSPDKQFFHCFGCQESGTALTFVMKYDHLDFVEAVEAMAQQLGLTVPREGGRARSEPPVDPNLYDVLEKAARHYRQALRDAPEAVSYLKERGLTGEVARDFGIGYAADEWQGVARALHSVDEALLLEAGLLTRNDSGRVYDRFRGRVMFPIRDTRGRVIAFGGRVMAGDNGPKYLNSPETPVFHKSQELYGLYEARRALPRIERFLVVEGYMDVVALAQFGILNAVATLGTASGTPHFKKLYRYADEVVCCFDGDRAGRQAAWKALENALPALTETRQLKLAFLPDGEDPDSLVRGSGREALQQLIDNAVPGLEFLLMRLSEGLDLDTLDGQARFAGLAKPYVERIPEGMLRSMLEARVQAMSGGRSAPRRQAQSRQPDRSRGSKNGLRSLSERLLTILLREPSLWRSLDTELRGSLIEALPGEGLTGAVVTYLEAHPEADAEELLVWFADAGDAELLKDLASRRVAIPAEALPGELRDIATAMVERMRKQARREALEAVKMSQNLDSLRNFVDLQRSKDDYA